MDELNILNFVKSTQNKDYTLLLKKSGFKSLFKKNQLNTFGYPVITPTEINSYLRYITTKTDYFSNIAFKSINKGWICRYEIGGYDDQSYPFIVKWNENLIKHYSSTDVPIDTINQLIEIQNQNKFSINDPWKKRLHYYSIAEIKIKEYSAPSVSYASFLIGRTRFSKIRHVLSVIKDFIPIQRTIIQPVKNVDPITTW